MSFQPSTKVNRRPGDSGAQSQSVSDAASDGVAKYDGRDWDAPPDYARKGYTHGLFGVHAIRGPLCVRWCKGPLTDSARERYLTEMRSLYGMAVDQVRFVAILPVE